MDVYYTKEFSKNFEKLKSQGNKNIIKKFGETVDKIMKGEKLDPSYRDHKLHGRLSGSRGCHISFDLVLIYSIENEILKLEQIGTHHDLKYFSDK